MEVFGGVFVSSHCCLDFSVRVGAFVIGLSQISFFFAHDKFEPVLIFKHVNNHSRNQMNGILFYAIINDLYNMHLVMST